MQLPLVILKPKRKRQCLELKVRLNLIRILQFSALLLKPYSIPAVIKVDKMNPCTICCEEAPKRPVACTYCRQTIGCRYCVKKWFFTTNVSHLDQRTPYPMGSTDRNHKRCPLCRADWGDTMRIVTAVERDAFPALIQVSNPPTSSNTEDPTKP